MLMNAYLQWMPKVLARSGSRLCWRAIACGLVAAFAIQLTVLSVVSLGAGGIVAARTAAMIGACLASLAAAAIAGLLASRLQHSHVVTNAYSAWIVATAVLAANVGLATDPTG